MTTAQESINCTLKVYLVADEENNIPEEFLGLFPRIFPFFQFNTIIQARGPLKLPTRWLSWHIDRHLQRNLQSVPALIFSTINKHLHAKSASGDSFKLRRQIQDVVSDERFTFRWLNLNSKAMICMINDLDTRIMIE